MNKGFYGVTGFLHVNYRLLENAYSGLKTSNILWEEAWGEPTQTRREHANSTQKN